jgi:hypothetical protein
MDIKFTANAICAAERALKKPFVEIVGELESEAGPALSTLRALLAAGISAAKWQGLPVALIDEHEAGRLIDERGVDAISADVGKALREYFITVGLVHAN